MILTGEKRVAFYNSARNTIQCNDCVLLVNEEGVNRYEACEEYRRTLNCLLYRHLNGQGKDDRTDSHSHTNYRCLSKPEMIQRMKSLHSNARIYKQQISHSHARIDDLINQKSITIKDDLSRHLKQVTEQYSSIPSAKYYP